MSYEGKCAGGLLGKLFVPDKKERHVFLPKSVIPTATVVCNYEEGDKLRVAEQSMEGVRVLPQAK